LNKDAKREQGKKAQAANIKAAKAVADIVRTTLGPKSMLKMLLDPMGGIVLTNDGNAILREIDVQHPAAKSMIELARAQDEEVGDGTTSVIILAGEVLAAVEGFLEKDIHPTVIVNAYFRALEEIVKITNELGVPINLENDEDLTKIVQSAIGTKFSSKWGDLIVNLAVKAVRCVYQKDGNDEVEIDIKRYAKVEKIPGGMLEDCEVLSGVMYNKDVTHPGMRRKMENPRVVLLDCPLEYKKGESMTNMEFKEENDFKKALKMEETEVMRMCEHILKVKPDIVITEKGVSDVAQHYLLKKGNVSCIRRVRKTDNNRIARVTGATIVNRPEELQESDVGTECGKFEVKKIGDDYFSFMTECKNPSACSIVLRGASKDVLNEIERNLHDAMGVARNVMQNPKLVPGGGAVEMELSVRMNAMASEVEGMHQWPYKALASALEVIPRTLAQNSGGDVVRMLTDLRARHAAGGPNSKLMGIDGNSVTIENMEERAIWDPCAVKIQTYKTAIESACMLLRIDDIVSGIKKEGRHAGGRKAEDSEDDTFGDARDG
jgi:T-complex protein 1 subunit gamma|tara:strand:+ start:114 stop:1757 length:1644 start_codon:yes stop_codon:yes gene_type:complete